MDPWSHIDLYCERLSQSYIAEPVNTISNLIYFLVGFVFLRSQKNIKDNYFAKALGCLAVLVGVGSTLFHILAVSWSRYADLIPIWTFVALYILYSLRHFFGLSWFKASVVLLAIVVLSYMLLTEVPLSIYVNTHGSVEYTPALVVAVLFSVLLFLRGHLAWRKLAAGSFSLAVALIFRTIDLTYCPVVPTGTHFLWHIFTGVAIFLLLSATSEKSIQTRLVEGSSV